MRNTTTQKNKKVFKKLLTSNQNSDNIKKSLEGDKKKWSLKIEQNNI